MPHAGRHLGTGLCFNDISRTTTERHDRRRPDLGAIRLCRQGNKETGRCRVAEVRTRGEFSDYAEREEPLCRPFFTGHVWTGTLGYCEIDQPRRRGNRPSQSGPSITAIIPDPAKAWIASRRRQETGSYVSALNRFCHGPDDNATTHPHSDRPLQR